MKKIISRLFVLLLLFTGCQENWSDYYTESEGGETETSTATANLLELLQSVPEYSEFVKLLQETKVAEELTRNQVLTVWAPTNATMPAEVATMSEKDKITLCKNHINYVALYTTKLTDNKVIKTLAGKNLTIKENGTDQYAFDGQGVTKLDQKCTNGVVHELAGWMIPRKNIFEYILEAGPEYSLIRDSLLARCDTVFKPGLSFPLGVDELGNTIYDSVFVIENDLLEYKSDIRSEDETFTVFLPTDQTIHNMYEEMNTYFGNIGSQMLDRDSIKFFGWILHSFIHQGKIENYTGTFTSPYGNEWRTEYQLINPAPQEFSNGLVYSVEKIHIPKVLYLSSIQAYPYYIGSLPDDEIPLHYQNSTGTASKGNFSVMDGHNVLYSATGSKADYWVEFDTFIKDDDGNVIEAKLAPGIYKVMASHRTWLAKNVQMLINGEVVATYNAGNSAYNYKPGVVKEEFVIKEEWANKVLRIRFVNVGKSDRICVEYLKFEPTKDNY